MRRMCAPLSRKQRAGDHLLRQEDMLAITFCGKKIYNADRMKFMKQYAPKPDKYAPFSGKDEP